MQWGERCQCAQSNQLATVALDLGNPNGVNTDDRGERPGSPGPSSHSIDLAQSEAWSNLQVSSSKRRPA